MAVCHTLRLSDAGLAMRYSHDLVNPARTLILGVQIAHAGSALGSVVLGPHLVAGAEMLLTLADDR